MSIHRMDVADPGSIQAAHAAISRETTQLDVILNNAGVYSSRGSLSPAESLGALRAEDAILVLRTNAIGPILVAQQYLDLLSASGQGRIVNMTSGYGSVSNNTSGYPYYYSASKAALNQLTRCLAADVRKRKIVAVVLNPGWVATDMGGKSAPLSPREAVTSLIDVIEGLTMKENGQFLNRLGEKEDW
jgi:NAD(P)-dependent dehydrogenase (short-subunit alcohol dehydrogenase family)